MFSKLGEAIQLLANNLLLLSMVILTVWLPGNLLINYLAFYVLDAEDVVGVVRAAMWIEGIFGPIYLGAMIYALWQIKQGRQVRYGEAMRVGFANWGKLFLARLTASVLIGLGLLLFIVPGVVLGLRYALLDCPVIVEATAPRQALRRSTRLTEGIRLRILGMVLLFYVAFIVVNMLIYVPIQLAQELVGFSLPFAMGSGVVADCVLDIVAAVLQIALFLYYWDKRQSELSEEQVTTPDADAEGDGNDIADAILELGDVQDDGNPYRPPQT